MKIDALAILQANFDYVKSLLTRRAETSNDVSVRQSEYALINPLLENTDSAEDLFRHGTHTLYHFSHYDFTPPEDLEFHPFEEKENQSLIEELIDRYQQTITAFSKYMDRAPSADIEKHQKLISILVMHLIGHVGQAIRLQKLYLEHRIIKEQEQSLTA